MTKRIREANARYPVISARSEALVHNSARSCSTEGSHSTSNVMLVAGFSKRRKGSAPWLAMSTAQFFLGVWTLSGQGSVKHLIVYLRWQEMSDRLPRLVTYFHRLIEAI